MARLINVATVSGEYLTENVSDTTQLTVELSALYIQKEADKALWLDNDPLSYTITITNVDPEDTPSPVTDITFTDTIDTKLVALDTSTLAVDGTTLTPGDYSYDPVTGLLTITSITVVNPGTPVVVTFQVTKI